MFGIVIPSTFSSSLKSYNTAHLTAYFDNSDIALANYLDWKVNSHVRIIIVKDDVV